MKNKINYLIDYFKYLKNPFSCLFFKFGIKKEVFVKFKNSNHGISISTEKLLNEIMGLIPNVSEEYVDEFVVFVNELHSSKEVISWGGVNVFNFLKEDGFDIYPFYEYFMKDHYRLFNINFKNRNVIDIGSFAGDTALFFAKNGATVYGFEPVKKNFEYSLRLRELNPNIKDKLNFFNLGVSNKPGILSINSMNSTSSFRDSKDSYDVDIVTLDHILKFNNIQPDILKIDCEGCEFNIILDTDLSNFKDIIFEHHAIFVGKDYKILTKKLINQGFKISKIESPTFDECGLIHAFKK